MSKISDNIKALEVGKRPAPVAMMNFTLNSTADNTPHPHNIYRFSVEAVQVLSGPQEALPSLREHAARSINNFLYGDIRKGLLDLFQDAMDIDMAVPNGTFSFRERVVQLIEKCE